MNNYVLIAIGGTGARVAQSVVAMTVAGLGKELGIDPNGEQSCLSVGLVDIDVNHCDGNELHDMIVAYNDAIGKHISQTGNVVPEKLEWKPMRIEELGVFDADIGRGESANITIDNMLTGESAKMTLMMQALLSEDDRKMDLRAGCKARPRIGATLWQELYEQDNNQFWNRVRGKSSPGNTTYYMFVGSLFGGTGASGVPTLSRLLRRSIDQNAKGTEKYGMTLIAPYFQLHPSNAEGVEVSVDPKKFPFESKMALGYYESDTDLLQTDFIQVVGDRPQDMKQYHEDKWTAVSYTPDDTGRQNNPSMPAELVAAIGIMEFFAGLKKKEPLLIQEHDVEANSSKSSVYSANMLPSSDVSGECLYRLVRYTALVNGYLNQIAQHGLLHKPVAFKNLWRNSAMANRNWLENEWRNEQKGVGGILTLANQLGRWLDELEHNGMLNLLRYEKALAGTSKEAKKGGTAFKIHGVNGGKMLGTLNNGTYTYYEGGYTGKRLIAARQKALMFAIMDACTD